MADIFDQKGSDNALPVGPNTKTADQLAAEGWVAGPWVQTLRGEWAQNVVPETQGYAFSYCQEIRRWFMPGSKTTYYEGGRLYASFSFCGQDLFRDVVVKDTAFSIHPGLQILLDSDDPSRFEKPEMLAFVGHVADLYVAYSRSQTKGGYDHWTPIPDGFRLGVFGKLVGKAIQKKQDELRSDKSQFVVTAGGEPVPAGMDFVAVKIGCTLLPPKTVLLCQQDDRNFNEIPVKFELLSSCRMVGRDPLTILEKGVEDIAKELQKKLTTAVATLLRSSQENQERVQAISVALGTRPTVVYCHLPIR